MYSPKMSTDHICWTRKKCRRSWLHPSSATADVDGFWANERTVRFFYSSVLGGRFSRDKRYMKSQTFGRWCCFKISLDETGICKGGLKKSQLCQSQHDGTFLGEFIAFRKPREILWSLGTFWTFFFGCICSASFAIRTQPGNRRSYEMSGLW